MSIDLSGWQAVCPVAELLPGEHTVCFDGDTAILVCNIDGEIYALEDKCTHQDFELSPGKLDGVEIECVLHGAKFDVRTGEAGQSSATVLRRKPPASSAAHRLRAAATGRRRARTAGRADRP